MELQVRFMPDWLALVILFSPVGVAVVAGLIACHREKRDGR